MAGPTRFWPRVYTGPFAQSRTTEVHLSSQEILRGYEIEPDRYVVFKPEEISALRPRTSTELEITEFVKLKEVDSVFLDTSYYVSPDRGGEKPYALLYRVLAESGDAAVGAFAMHSREHAAVIRPGARGLILHTLFHYDEVEQEEEANADTRLISENELQLAKMLVSTMAAPFDPSKLKDAFRERLLETIESRSRSPVGAARPEKQEPAPVIDIMEALQKSLQAIRKPAAREVSGGRIHKKEKRRAQ